MTAVLDLLRALTSDPADASPRQRIAGAALLLVAFVAAGMRWVG